MKLTNDEAIIVLQKYMFLNEDDTLYTEAVGIAIDAILKEIRKGVDEEKRPKGKWKAFVGSAYYGLDEDNEPIWRERKIYHCPKCNRRTVIKENFCPNCGIDLRGDKNEDHIN